MRITGPVSITKLVKKDKQIWLFGDVHQCFREQGCNFSITKKTYVLPEFMDQLIKKSGQTWDVYLEQGSGHEEFSTSLTKTSKDAEKKYNKMIRYWDRSDNNILLFLVMAYFQRYNCFLEYKKKECLKKTNSRFHFIDIRQNPL